MAADTFDADVDRLITSANPSDEDNLLGMQMDFDYFIPETAGVDPSTVMVRTTTDSRQLIAVTCSPLKGVSTDLALGEIERTWTDRLRYPYFENHRSSITADEGLFEFVTQVKPGEFFVTGTVRVKTRREAFDPGASDKP